MPFSRQNYPTTIVLFTLWFGLVTGFIEAWLLLFQQIALDTIVYRSREFLWMTPLSGAIVFSFFGIFLALIASRRPRMVPLPGIVFFYTFLGTINIALIFGQSTRLFLLFAAATLGILLAKFAAKKPNWMKGFIFRSVPWLAGILLLSIFFSNRIVS